MKVDIAALVDLSNKEIIELSGELLFSAFIKEDSKLRKIFLIEEGEVFTSRLLQINALLLSEIRNRFIKQNDALEKMTDIVGRDLVS